MNYPKKKLKKQDPLSLLHLFLKKNCDKKQFIFVF